MLHKHEHSCYSSALQEKKNHLYICLHTVCSDTLSGHTGPSWSEVQKSYVADMLTMRRLLLHLWCPCAASINRQRPESLLACHHLSRLTPSLTSYRMKSSTLQCAAGEGRAWQIRGSPALEEIPAKLTAKGMWGPEKGMGDLRKPPRCALAAGKGAGSTCRGSMHPTACYQGASARGLRGVFCVLYLCTGLP